MVEQKDTHFFALLSRALWRMIVGLIVFLAIYVSLGRLLAANFDYFGGMIANRIDGALPLTVAVERTSLRWQSLSPILVLQNVEITSIKSGYVANMIRFESADLKLNVFETLRNRVPAFDLLIVKDMALDLALPRTRSPRVSTSFKSFTSALSDVFEPVLSKTRRVLVDSADLRLSDGAWSYETALNFDYWREGSERQLILTLRDREGGGLEFRASGLGNPLKSEEFEGVGYLDLSVNSAVLPTKTQRLPDWLELESGEVGLELFWQAQPSDWRMGGEWFINSVSPIVANESIKVPAAMGGRFRFDTDWRDSRLSLTEQTIEVDTQTFGLPDLRVDWVADTVSVSSALIDIAAVAELITAISADTTGALLDEVNPRGQVKNLKLRQFGDGRREVVADLTDVALEGSVKRVGVTGLSGRLWARDNDVLVKAETPRLTLDIQSVYDQALVLDNPQALLHIKVTPDAVRIVGKDIEARAALGKVYGNLKLELPLSPSTFEPEMVLMLSAPEALIGVRNTVIPKTIPESLQTWLDRSIVSGGVYDAGFFYRGSLVKESRESRSIGLTARLEDTELRFLLDWPNLTAISGSLILDDEETSVWVDRGSFPATQVYDTSVEVWLDQNRLPFLAASAALKGPFEGLLADLRASPLLRYIPADTLGWAIQGEQQADLDIQTPLTGVGVVPQVSFQAQFSGVSLNPLEGIHIHDLNGLLSYSTAEGFFADELVGVLWEQPLRARITSDVSNPLLTRIDVAGTLPGRELSQLLNLPSMEWLQGASTVQAALNLGQDKANLSIASSLEGISIHLPYPAKKSAEEIWNSAIDINLADHDKGFSGDIKDQFSVSGRLNPDRFGVSLGIGAQPLEVESAAFIVTGSLDTLDLDSWQSSLPSSEGTSKWVYDARAMEFIQLRYLDREIENVLVDARAEGDQWFVAAKADWLDAALTVMEGKPWQLRVEDLNLTQALTVLNGNLQTDTVLSLNDVPELDLDIRRIREQERLIGGGILQFRPASTLSDEHSARILSGNWRGLTVDSEKPIRLVWDAEEPVLTQVSGGLTLDNMGDILESYGYEPFIETRSGAIDFSLRWPGGPEAFGFAGTEGALQVRLRKGKFTKASAGARGALRVVTILNFADIINRLSLSQLFESGVPFDDLELQANTSLGLIEVSTLSVQSSASHFQFGGRANLLDESLDGDLIATLPVANNLPWLAALTGGLPAAAGVYVISKIFEKQVDKFSSAVYRVSGTWQEPVLKFDRLFDTKPRVQKSNSSVPATALESKPESETDSEPRDELETDSSYMAEPAPSEVLGQEEAEAPPGP